MRKLALALCMTVVGVAQAQALAPSICLNQDFPLNLCGIVPPLLSILPTPISSSLLAAGTLTGTKGQTVTVTRASSKYCQGSTNLVLLGNNTPCVEAPGLLVEGASTNLVLQSSNIGGTSWLAVNATIAAPVVVLATTDVTAPDGSSTASKLTFPASTAAAQYSLVYQNVGPITAGGTISVYLRSLSGPQTFYLSTDANPAYVACAVTSTWKRFSLTVPTGNSQYLMLGTDTRAANANEPLMAAQTVYAWGGQAETIPFASSYIPTTTATVTRAADVVTVSSPAGLTVGGKLRLQAKATTEAGSWGNAFYNNGGSVVLDLATGEPNRTSLYIGVTVPPALSVFNEDASGTHSYTVQTSSLSALVGGGATGTFASFGAYSNGPQLYVNGVANGAITGSGTGPVAIPATIYIGSNYVGSGNLWAWVSDIVVDTK